MGFEAPVALESEAVLSTAAGLRAWISSGACQSPSGAFAAWFDLAAGRRSYEYPEISGYALTYLASQASLSDQESVAGHRAAEWLVARVRGGNLAARDDWDNSAVYLFDLGMIASGLLSFGRRTRVDRFIETGRDLVSFLDGEIASGSAISPVSARGRRSGREMWSTRGVAHLAKLVQAFLLNEGVGSRAQGERLTGLIDTVKRLQYADGRMRTDCDETTTMLHPHLYAAEGLWIWGSAWGEDDSLEHARAAVEWVWRHQLEHGGLPRSVTSGRRGDVAEQSDVTAQAVRLALALGLRSEAVDRAIARIIEFTREHEGTLGIVYQPASPNSHLNTWATLFAAQAMAMVVPGAPVISWREIV